MPSKTEKARTTKVNSAGNHLPRFLPKDVPHHIVSRVFQGRFLLRPEKKLNDIIAGVMAKAATLFQEVKVYAYAFLSNHAHLMLKGPAHQIAGFVGYIKREISRRWANDPKVNWPGTMWTKYIATALPTPESQIQCLKYILSHGVKEKIVAKPTLWPGVHAAKQLQNGTPLRGQWLNSTLWTKQRDAQNRKAPPKPGPKNHYYEDYILELTPIDPWSTLSKEEYKQKIEEMLKEIEDEGQKARGGKKPLGIKEVLNAPLNRKTELTKPPWLEIRERMICWANPDDEQTKLFVARYWEFQAEFCQASVQFRSGMLDVAFPKEAFRPMLWAYDAAA